MLLNKNYKHSGPSQLLYIAGFSLFLLFASLDVYAGTPWAMWESQQYGGPYGALTSGGAKPKTNVAIAPKLDSNLRLRTSMLVIADGNDQYAPINVGSGSILQMEGENGTAKKVKIMSALHNYIHLFTGGLTVAEYNKSVKQHKNGSFSGRVYHFISNSWVNSQYQFADPTYQEIGGDGSGIKVGSINSMILGINLGGNDYMITAPVLAKAKIKNKEDLKYIDIAVATILISNAQPLKIAADSWAKLPVFYRDNTPVLGPSISPRTLLGYGFAGNYPVANDGPNLIPLSTLKIAASSADADFVEEKNFQLISLNLGVGWEYVYTNGALYSKAAEQDALHDVIRGYSGSPMIIKEQKADNGVSVEAAWIDGVDSQITNDGDGIAYTSIHSTPLFEDADNYEKWLFREVYPHLQAL